MPSPPDSHVPRQGSKGSQSPTNSSTDVSDRPANSAPSTNIDTASGAGMSLPSRPWAERRFMLLRYARV
ncbi:hypothetical protein DL93DRAFT_2081030 [Clavulina sp. PMI_390]|nr:hypothetical protein DL93DRAFT_2081030 [Clavulina sp. PMI_390]